VSPLLSNGHTLRAESSGATYTIERYLGGGGQGEVYQVAFGNEQVAIKWYLPSYRQQDKHLQKRLERAINIGPPSDRFLWPRELVFEHNGTGLGYVMALREARFKGIASLMSGKVEPTFKVLATAGFELAHNYKELHSKGLCYYDINFGNVFFDPDTGEIRVCDNDNVDTDNSVSVIGGTQRFMAPEIVRGEASPSTRTDLHSLAVLLFYMLIINHPLEGRHEYNIRCLDDNALRQLYGTKPLFIFDSTDSSNEPVPGWHDNAIIFWKLYPQFLKTLFIRAFGEGLHNPDLRVQEGQWRDAMLRLRDSIYYCRACSAANFYDEDALKTMGKPAPCWSCEQPMKLPPRMRLKNKRHMLMLDYNTKLYPHHIDENRAFDFSKPVAEVVQHPSNPAIWGLKNLTQYAWTSTVNNGELKNIDPGKSVTITNNTKINFGKEDAEIRVG
jgi:eukaryotic-like serine/threonine-protein kinase